MRSWRVIYHRWPSGPQSFVTPHQQNTHFGLPLEALGYPQTQYFCKCSLTQLVGWQENYLLESWASSIMGRAGFWRFLDSKFMDCLGKPVEGIFHQCNTWEWDQVWNLNGRAGYGQMELGRSIWITSLSRAMKDTFRTRPSGAVDRRARWRT